MEIQSQPAMYSATSGAVLLDKNGVLTSSEIGVASGSAAEGSALPTPPIPPTITPSLVATSSTPGLVGATYITIPSSVDVALISRIESANNSVPVISSQLDKNGEGRAFTNAMGTTTDFKTIPQRIYALSPFTSTTVLGAMDAPPYPQYHDYEKETSSKRQLGWTPEEDQLVIELVKKFGTKKWAHIGSFFKRRTGKQCRERWHNHLNPDIRKDAWTHEEDSIIVNAHMRIGSRWSEISKRLPGRTDNAIKNRWNSMIRRVTRQSKGKTQRKSSLLALTPPEVPIDTIESSPLFKYCAELMAKQNALDQEIRQTAEALALRKRIFPMDGQSGTEIPSIPTTDESFPGADAASIKKRRSLEESGDVNQGISDAPVPSVMDEDDEEVKRTGPEEEENRAALDSDLLGAAHILFLSAAANGSTPPPSASASPTAGGSHDGIPSGTKEEMD